MLSSMKTMTSSAELEQDIQRYAEKSRYIFWSVYLLVAAGLLTLWFVVGSALFSYLFGGWMLIGAMVLWFIEDSAEH
jgi:hypothetical protein